MADQAHVRPALRPWPIIVLCLIAAAVAGGAATSVIFTGLMWVLDAPGMSIGERGLVVLVIAFAIATPLCLLGLLVPGLPVWLALRGLGKDSLAVCVISGGLASLLFGVAWLLINGAAGLADLGGSGLVLAPVFAVPGLLCGWIMRRFAYRLAVAARVKIRPRRGATRASGRHAHDPGKSARSDQIRCGRVPSGWSGRRPSWSPGPGPSPTPPQE